MVLAWFRKLHNHLTVVLPMHLGVKNIRMKTEVENTS